MTESRVEAVAAPLEQFLKRSVGLTDYAAGQYAKELAVQAIEANDAWLKVQVAPQKPCPSCEEPCSIEEMECPKCGVALW